MRSEAVMHVELAGKWQMWPSFKQFCLCRPYPTMPLQFSTTHSPLPTTTTTTTTTPAAKYRFLLPLLVFVVPFFPTVVTFYTTLDNLVTLQYQLLIPPSLPPYSYPHTSPTVHPTSLYHQLPTHYNNYTTTSTSTSSLLLHQPPTSSSWPSTAAASMTTTPTTTTMTSTSPAVLLRLLGLPPATSSMSNLKTIQWLWVNFNDP